MEGRRNSLDFTQKRMLKNGAPPDKFGEPTPSFAFRISLF